MNASVALGIVKPILQTEKNNTFRSTGNVDNELPPIQMIKMLNETSTCGCANAKFKFKTKFLI